MQRRFDELFGLDHGDVSNRPSVPEFTEPVFFDLARPLGAAKYSNEINYLYNSSSLNAPGLQIIEYEYALTDWRAAELDLSYFNGDLQILTPFYQRTLGVGSKRNWAHGFQLSLDVYLRSGFIGGSPVYLFAWKPEEESRFCSTFFVGANRALIGGFNPARFGMPGSIARTGSGSETDRTFGSWRPLFNADFGYTLTERWAIAIENDFFFQTGVAAEHLSFPYVTYKPNENLFIQVGGGYYHFESRDQFTFFVHVNLVNPSGRRPKEQGEKKEIARSEESSRTWLDRISWRSINLEATRPTSYQGDLGG